MKRKLAFQLLKYCSSGLLLVCFQGAAFNSASAEECQNWQGNHPEWIFCDDFEDGTPLVRQGRYFEHDNNNGDFVITAGVGLNASNGMRARWQTGEVQAGNIKLAFGKNPNAYMDKGIRATENFREIYYRMYLKMQGIWQGSPNKLSRATIITDNIWSQAMIAHLWSDSIYHLLLDPVRCVDQNNAVACLGYNNFAKMVWLGAKAGSTTIFDSQHAGTWYCVETHVKLNDSGQSNGIHEFWIDGSIEASSTGLNFVNSYATYGINAVFFENYWNNGSPKLQERYFDNIVVSTQPVGCTASTALSPPRNVRVVP